QLEIREYRIEDVRDGGGGFEVEEQGAEEGGLTGTDLAGDGDEPAALTDPEQQVPERLSVVGAEVQVTGVGCQAKGRLGQAVERFVHRNESSNFTDSFAR